MSGIHSTHRAPAHAGPRFSASDRPLPKTEARMTRKSRAWLWASILVVYGLAALAIVAPTATLALLLGAVVAGGVLWGMHHLADRGARSWGAGLPRATDPAPRDVTRRDT